MPSGNEKIHPCSTAYTEHGQKQRLITVQEAETTRLYTEIYLMAGNFDLSRRVSSCRANHSLRASACKQVEPGTSACPAP